MAEEKKQEYVDVYAAKNTKDLLNEFKELTSYKKQKEIEEQKEDAVIGYEEFENKYFLNKRGEHAKHKGRAKSKKIKKKYARQEAQDLVNELLLHTIKEELGEKHAEAYKKKPYLLVKYAAGHGIEYFKLIDALASNTHMSVNKIKAYQQAKQDLAHATVEDDQKLEHVKTHMLLRKEDKEHVNAIKDDFAETTGTKLKDETTLDKILFHLEQYQKSKSKKGEAFDEAYMEVHGDDFTPSEE